MNTKGTTITKVIDVPFLLLEGRLKAASTK